MNRSSYLSAITLAALFGCGGGGGGGSTPATATTPPPTTSPDPVNLLVSGVITGFSSVYVDGNRYEVEADTLVDIEDEAETRGDDSRLKVGMKVRVRARQESGRRIAESIEYDDDLKGPARDVTPDSENPEIGTFSVLAQTVIVDDNSVLDDDIGDNDGNGSVDIRDLAPTGSGEIVVEVSGLPTADGFLATRIERINSVAGDPDVDDDEFEVKGFVDEVAEDGSSFAINGAVFQVVEGAGGTVFEDGLSPDESLLGVFVEVEADEDDSGGLIARKVERQDDIGDANDDGDLDEDDRDGELEIKAILISVDTSVSPNIVVIGSTTFQVADASSLVGLEGTLVELDGRFDENGVLFLDEVEVEEENTVRTEDRIADLDTAAGTFTTRLGLVIAPAGGSRLEDDVEEGGDRLTPEQFLGRLDLGDFIEARGVPTSAGVSWTRIEREDEDDQHCELRGPVTEITGTAATDFTFTIQGVVIDVSQLEDDDFEGLGDQPIGRQAFFDELDPGDVVEASSDDAGTGCEDGRLTAREVEFEADDDVVGTAPPAGDNAGNDQITGTPESVTSSTFVIGSATITVVGSTLIDDSIIEAALGREYDGGDRPFDQVPEGLTLPELLPGTFPVQVVTNGDGVALSIEDL